MKCYYNYYQGRLSVKTLDGIHVIVSDDDFSEELPIYADDAGKQYFVVHGEIIYLSDWKILELTDNSEDYDGSTVIFDNIVVLFLRSMNIKNASFKIKECVGNKIETNIYKVTKLVNKDRTGMYKLLLESDGGAGSKQLQFYSGEFRNALRDRKIIAC